MPHIENIQKENFEDQIVTPGNVSEISCVLGKSSQKRFFQQTEI
jgi:hypothetical protein